MGDLTDEQDLRVIHERRVDATHALQKARLGVRAALADVDRWDRALINVLKKKHEVPHA